MAIYGLQQNRPKYRDVEELEKGASESNQKGAIRQGPELDLGKPSYEALVLALVDVVGKSLLLGHELEVTRRLSSIPIGECSRCAAVPLV